MDQKKRPSTAFKKIASLDVNQLWDAYFLLPSGYVDYSNPIINFAELPRGDSKVFLKARVVSMVGLDKNHKPSPEPVKLIMRLTDGVSEIECDIFNIRSWAFIREDFVVTMHATLKDNPFRGRYLSSPVRADVTTVPGVEYKGTSSLVSGKAIAKWVNKANQDPANLQNAISWLREQKPFVAGLIEKHWGSPESFLQAIHTPPTIALANKALRFARRLCVAEVRHNGRLSVKPASSIPPIPALRRAIWDALQSQPERLSKGQIDALADAVPVLSGAAPGRVLLNGDVGSGKTLVMLGIAAGFAKLGMAVSIMAPNGTVAHQIFRQFERRFPDIACKYVAGGTKLAGGEANVWIGTTALLFAKERPEFRLCIVDEQHKFSREQREALLSPSSHLIEATATPIPRSLAVALFDGFTLAQIATPPVQRKIVSHLIGPDRRRDIVRLCQTMLSEQKRVIFLYAAVKESTKEAQIDGEEPMDTTSLKTVTATYDNMSLAYPDKVAMVHGQMKNDVATGELAAFRSGDKPILIASTSIEVGLDVPGVGLVVVTNPERFGVAQLHQIRGRLARDGGTGHFAMFYGSDVQADAYERLLAVRNINDGYQLAERDLEIRGFGEVAGEMQSGATKTAFRLSQITARDFLVGNVA